MFKIAPIVGLCLGLTVVHGLAARADDYPSRSVRLILSVEPGGSADTTARILAKHLTDLTKQPYLVESKPGASGMVAVGYEVSRPADGYTLLYAADALAAAPWLVANQQQSLESVQDMTPITIVGIAPFVFVVNPKIPVKTPPELVAYIKTHPDFRWSIGGIGVPGQLAIGRFSKQAGFDIGQQIPYKGAGPATLAVLNGEVDGTAAQPPAVQALIAAGKLTGIGVASLKPTDAMPGMPTMASFGYPGLESLSWYAIWGPKNLPAALARQIRDQVATVAKDPDFIQGFSRAGFTATVSDSPEAFAATFKADLAKSRDILKDLNIKPQGD